MTKAWRPLDVEAPHERQTLNVKLAQLKSFAALAEELHFGTAAARVHVSQPPFSRQIQSLERELGVALVIRSNQRVILTPAGAAFYKAIQKVFSI